MIGRKVHTDELHKENIFVLPKDNINNKFGEKKKIPLKQKNKKVKKRTFSESTINILSYFKNDKIIKLKEKDNEKYTEKYRKTGTPHIDINNSIKSNINSTKFNNVNIINPLITNIDNLNIVYRKVNEKSYLDVNSCHKRIRSEHYQSKIFLEEKIKLNNIDYKNNTCNEVDDNLNHFKKYIHGNDVKQNENYLYDKNIKINDYPIHNKDEILIEKEKYYEYLENVYLYSKKYFLSDKMEYISKYLFYKNKNLKNFIFLIDSLFLKKKYVEILELLRNYRHLWIFPIHMKNKFKVKNFDKKEKINNIDTKNMTNKKHGNKQKNKNTQLFIHQNNIIYNDDKIINNNKKNNNNKIINNNINNNNNNNIYTDDYYNSLYKKEQNLKLFRKNIECEHFNRNKNIIFNNMKLYDPQNIPIQNTNDYIPKKINEKRKKKKKKQQRKGSR
ncbi:hypothetical protein PFNF54_02107 [Plasmodium falciparum NF54]|uniref:Uncharacterized protein n=1 Tax=Plasmodium falciparum (isolate NF54) TaxID=5843 RepID=W7KHW8_PLAFO|nr:hypothetical protein PFNF54_02107 [Plasmodium falciparum NF54]